MDWMSAFNTFKSLSTLESLKAAERRLKAFEEFQSLGLPTKKLEAFKYTSLKPFESIEWTIHDENEVRLTHDQMQEVSKQLPSEFYNFVFVNGVLNSTLSDDAEGLLTIAEVEDQDFETDPEMTESGLHLLSKSFWTKKCCVELSKQRILDRPVQLLFVQTSAKSVYLSEKIDLLLNENSEMKLIVNSISFSNSTADALNLNLRVQLLERARLHLIQVQNEDLSSFHFSQTQFSLADSAVLKTLVISLGNLLTRNYLKLDFLGQHAEAEVYGLAVLEKDQHVDNYTYIKHSLGENNSIQHYKSVLGGESHSVFRGRVRIEPNAQKANSEQLNNNLLLTRKAQADSVPQLEIFADDVKAGHGSTVGQLNQDEIFYFLSRGINQLEAVKMLSVGFASELALKFDNLDMQNFINSKIVTKLKTMVDNAGT